MGFGRTKHDIALGYGMGACCPFSDIYKQNN